MRRSFSRSAALLASIFPIKLNDKIEFAKSVFRTAGIMSAGSLGLVVLTDRVVNFKPWEHLTTGFMSSVLSEVPALGVQAALGECTVRQAISEFTRDWIEVGIVGAVSTSVASAVTNSSHLISGGVTHWKIGAGAGLAAAFASSLVETPIRNIRERKRMEDGPLSYTGALMHIVEEKGLISPIYGIHRSLLRTIPLNLLLYTAQEFDFPVVVSSLVSQVPEFAINLFRTSSLSAAISALSNAVRVTVRSLSIPRLRTLLFN